METWCVCLRAREFACVSLDGVYGGKGWRLPEVLLEIAAGRCAAAAYLSVCVGGVR